MHVRGHVTPGHDTHSQHRGFTFVEVIVVVAILGIISLILVFSVGASLIAAKRSYAAPRPAR